MLDEPNPADGKNKLPAYVAALLEPSSYPHPTEQIRLLQTHISYVILTGQHAYKIKKAVDFGFLDYSTLKKREHFCHEEVRLNSRLCPQLYLGVVPISETGGRVAVGPGHRLLDFAVHMIELPEDRMMDYMLERSLVTPEMMRRLASRLVGFYEQASAGPDVAQYGDLHWIHLNTKENFAQTQQFIGQTISLRQHKLIRRYTERFIASNRPLFARRIAEGRIRDGHGDLRPTSVCFGDDICIFDCVEFNDRLRCGDVASDIAFLAMELEYRQRHDLARDFVETYIRLSNDKDAIAILQFYKVYRAYVRGKIKSLEIAETEIPEAQRKSSFEAARHYFALAAAYIGA